MEVHKPFKTLDEQCEHLKKSKLVNIENSEDAKKVLLDANYYNIITCGKVRFAEDVVNREHIYEKSDFTEWEDYYKNDKALSNHLRSNVLNFELVLNSRTAYFISELMETNNSNNNEKESIKQIIKASKNVAGVDYTKYIGYETWTFITKMTFGDTKKLVFWLLENKFDVYEKVIKGYTFLDVQNVTKAKNRLNELNNLRNSLFHFTPLSIYLVYGKKIKNKLNNSEKIKVTNWVYRLGGNQRYLNVLDNVIYHSKRFIKIKNKK